MTEVTRYQFYLNSQNAILDVSQDSPCYFKVYLNRVLQLTNPDNQFVLQVEKVTIPNCFYQFTSQNLSSYFAYQINGPLGLIYSGSISVPDGNYSISDMGNTLATLLPVDIMTNVPAITNCTINWTYDQIGNKFSMQILGSLYFGSSWDLIFGANPISIATGFTDEIGQQATVLTVNDPLFSGGFQVNMNPISEIYVVSNILTDNNAFQAFPIDSYTVQTTVSGIVAVVQLEHPSPYYIIKDYILPTRIPLDKSTIDIIDFDLRDYNNQPLYGLWQRWNITFSIIEVENDTQRQSQLKTFITPIPPPINQVNFLERNRLNEENTQSLEQLKEQLTQSIEQLRKNVQKRKSPSTTPATVLEGATGTNSTASSGPTLTPADAGKTEQTSIDIDGSAKRQRESQEIPENLNS